jgi:uncharacterized protein YbjT (DUF2867 family)
MKPKIAFIGATGMLGKPVARQMLQNGLEVYALARDPEKAKSELTPGINIIKGDVKNAADLDNLFAGKDVVYLSLSVKQSEKRSAWHTESDGLKLILTAAKKHNIKRIVYLSSMVMFYQDINNFNWWVFELKHKAVKMLKGSGIPYTIFYPTNFMESLNGMYKMGNKMMLAGISTEPMYFISADDYGKQVSRAILEQNNGNKEYYVQGPEAFTADDAVNEFIKHYKKSKLSISRAPLGVLKFFGRFNTKMNYGSHILEALNNYPEKFVSQKTWDELGKPETTIKKYTEAL